MENIVTAKFNSLFHSKDVYGLTQWDIGQYLRVEGLNLPENAEIQFSLQDYIGSAKRAETLVEDGVAIAKIPQFILENERVRGTTYSAYAFVYVNGADSGETVGKIRLSIRIRPKPEDYVYTEEEVKQYTKLEKRVETLEKQANGVEETIMDTLISLKVAPVVLDYDGAVLVDSDGAILLNM